jgi:hypothetical protein
MKIIMPKKILKRTVIAGIVSLPLLMFIFPQWFPGTLNSVKDFEIDLLNSIDEPDIRDREPGKAYPEGYKVEFYHIVSDQFNYHSFENFWTTRPHEKLYIQEIAWEWEEESGIFAQNVSENFTENQWLYAINGWHIFFTNHIPDNINFAKMFRKKKIGEIFPFRLVIRYRFDDEPEIIQVLEYQVTARKGRYRRTYTFLF